VLCFLRHRGAVLLIEGARRKRWAGRLQGIGGGVQPGEAPLGSAIREIREETGLEVPPEGLRLTGVVLSQDFYGRRNKLVLLFAADVRSRRVRAGEEGRLRWIPLRTLARQPNLIPDLYALIPRVFALRPGEALSGVAVFDGAGGLRSLDLTTVRS